MKRAWLRTVVLTAGAVAFLSIGAAVATEEPAPETTVGEGAAQDRQLAEGRVVYEANCLACHQSDGAGVVGVFPPLLANERVQDTTYLTEVIAQGRQGELTVDGVTYDGAMPAFAALSEEQVASLVLYVQEGLGMELPPPADPVVSPARNVGLPLSAVLAAVAGFGVAGVAVLAIAGPVALARRRSGTFSTVQTWLKALAIFVYFVVATVFVPSLVVESSFLASPPSIYLDLFSGETWGVIRDLIGTGVWLAALVLGIWALRRAQREEVI